MMSVRCQYADGPTQPALENRPSNPAIFWGIGGWRRGSAHPRNQACQEWVTKKPNPRTIFNRTRRFGLVCRHVIHSHRGVCPDTRKYSIVIWGNSRVRHTFAPSYRPTPILPIPISRPCFDRHPHGPLTIDPRPSKPPRPTDVRRWKAAVGTPVPGEPQALNEDSLDDHSQRA